MTRRAFLKKYLPKFALALCLTALILFTVYHVVGFSSGSLMTTPARQVTDHRIVGGDGYLFRDETVLYASSPGVSAELVPTGSKVAKREPLVTVWSGYDPALLADTQVKVGVLNRMIAVLKDSSVPAGTPLSKAEGFRQGAERSLLSLRKEVEAGNYVAAGQMSDELLAFLNRYTTLTRPETAGEISALLAELEERRNALLTDTFVTVTNEGAPGYFYGRNSVDGGEAKFTEATLRSLTPETLRELKQTAENPVSDPLAVGKIARGYAWYLAVQLPLSGETLKENARYPIRFSESGGKTMNLILERVIPDGEACIAVFRSDDVPADFTYRRLQRVEVTVGECNGYYVPDSALHRVGGVDGVYIFFDSTVYFRRVEILYRGDGYCIVAEQGDKGRDYLALNDILITAGKNLYDGKVY